MSRRLVFALAALVAILIMGSVLVLRSRFLERGGPGGQTIAPTAPERVRALGETIEIVGRAPSQRLLFHPSGRGQLHSGGSVSYDWGRTWRSLAGPDGSNVVLLGGRRALPFAFGPDGRLLLGEVLVEPAGTEPGQGLIAHAVEWSGTSWDVLEAVPAIEPEAPPEFLVRGVGYLPGGIAAVALPYAIRFADGKQREAPGVIRAFLAASDGTMYVAVEGTTRFPLYCASGATGPWLPVGGVRRIDAMAEGSGGAVYLVGERLGRGHRGVVDWDPSGLGFAASHLIAHPRAPLLAAWGQDSLLLVSRDGGQSFFRVRWGDLRVAWASFDPELTDSFLVVDRAGTIHRLSLMGDPPSTDPVPHS